MKIVRPSQNVKINFYFHNNIYYEVIYFLRIWIKGKPLWAYRNYWILLVLLRLSPWVTCDTVSLVLWWLGRHGDQPQMSPRPSQPGINISSSPPPDPQQAFTETLLILLNVHWGDKQRGRDYQRGHGRELWGMRVVRLRPQTPGS